jgi:hypothetical protein
VRHYHLSEHTVGDSDGYRDEIFRTQRCALEAAKMRAEWLAALSGLHVEPLVERGRFLVTSGRPHDAGRMIWIERCDEADCLKSAPRIGG